MVWIPDIVLYNRYFFQKVFNNYTLIKKTLKNNKYKHADLLYMFQSVEKIIVYPRLKFSLHPAGVITPQNL